MGVGRGLSKTELKFDKECGIEGRFKRGLMHVHGTPKDEGFSRMKDIHMCNEVIPSETHRKEWRVDDSDIEFPVAGGSMDDSGNNLITYDGEQPRRTDRFGLVRDVRRDSPGVQVTDHPQRVSRAG